MHIQPISPFTVMERGLCRLVEADKSYTVPSLASAACLQPAGAIEDSIQDVFEGLQAISWSPYINMIYLIHELEKSTRKHEK